MGNEKEPTVTSDNEDNDGGTEDERLLITCN